MVPCFSIQLLSSLIFGILDSVLAPDISGTFVTMGLLTIDGDEPGKTTGPPPNDIGTRGTFVGRDGLTDRGLFVNETGVCTGRPNVIAPAFRDPPCWKDNPLVWAAENRGTREPWNWFIGSGRPKDAEGRYGCLFENPGRNVDCDDDTKDDDRGLKLFTECGNGPF